MKKNNVFAPAIHALHTAERIQMTKDQDVALELLYIRNLLTKTSELLTSIPTSMIQNFPVNKVNTNCCLLAGLLCGWEVKCSTEEVYNFIDTLPEMLMDINEEVAIANMQVA